MKKVALLLTPVEFGGAEKVGLTLLKNIQRNLFDVRPILLIRPWEEKGFFTRELEKLDYDYQTIPVALYERHQKRDYWRVLRCAGLLRSMARKEQFDLIHTNGYFADIIGIPVAKSLGIPALAMCHGFVDSDAKLRLYNRLDLLILRLGNRVICVSEELRRLLVRWHVSSRRVCLLRNAVDAVYDPNRFSAMRKEARRAFGVTEGEILLGSCGRLSAEKGLANLVEAGSSLLAAGLPVKILLIGDGPERLKLERLAMSSNLRERCMFSGFREDVLAMLPAIDVFVLPSFTEGTPMALLEAMGQGIPVVASSVGEVPTIVAHDRSGILVEPGQVAQIAGAVRRIVENAEFREGLSQKERETIDNHFGIQPWICEIERHYTELINKRRRT
ncbi:MAG: glycosyltransferase [Syntrophorhabdales bacterium]|jgi:glycosyltransferase involved in cell wall biosynthesis